MFHIDTTTPRWRRLATTGLALPLAVVLTGTAHAAGPSADPKVKQTSSAAQLALDVDCFSVSVSSDKDISNVKVTFADGSFQEIESLSGYSFDRTFDKQVASATAKSGTTQVEDAAGTCAVAPPAPAEPEPADENPVVPVPVEEAVTPGKGTAVLTIEVDCFTVSVQSDKDISNVKVTFADGSFEEIEGLSGYTFERTFTEEIASATTKSATTTVEGQASDCAVAPVGGNPAVENPVVETPVVENPVVENPVVETPVGENPVVETPAPICPTVSVMGPIMEGCEPVVEETPVQIPTQDIPVDGTPIADQPAPQPATGGAAGGELDTPVEATPVEVTPISDRPAAVPATGVLGMGAAAPTAVTPVLELPVAAPAATSVVAQQTPATLPFTGVDAGLLAQLGSLLLAVGGSALLLGRKPRRAKH